MFNSLINLKVQDCTFLENFFLIINNDYYSTQNYKYQSWNSVANEGYYYLSGGVGYPTNILQGKTVLVGGYTSTSSIKSQLSTILNQTAKMWVETSIYQKDNNINFKVYITNKNSSFVGAKKIFFYVLNQRADLGAYIIYKETIAYYTSIDYTDTTSEVDKTVIVEKSIPVDANASTTDAYPWTPWDKFEDKTGVYFVVVVQNATYNDISSGTSHWKGYEIGSAAGVEWVNIPLAK